MILELIPEKVFENLAVFFLNIHIYEKIRNDPEFEQISLQIVKISLRI